MSTGMLAENCKHCPEYGSTCDGNDAGCICFRCPRNFGQCMIIKYCRETESVLDLVSTINTDRESMIEEYYHSKNME